MIRPTLVFVLVILLLPSCRVNKGAFMEGFADGMSSSSSYDYAARERQRRMERKQQELEDRLEKQEREMADRERKQRWYNYTGTRLY